MGNHLPRKSTLLFLAVLLLSACSATEESAEMVPTAEVFPSAEPTVTPAPTLTPTPQLSLDWVGEWFVWTGDTGKSAEMSLSADGNQISATIEKGGEVRSIKAEMSMDGITLTGGWESPDGKTGPVAMLISEDRQSFVGNLGGQEMFCGSREGSQKPKPCFTEFGAYWSGEWVAWLGPEESEVVLFFKQDENAVSIMLYDFEGTVSDDGRVLTGQFDAFGFSGKLEARLLDNLAQFNGNMLSLAPFCGVRRGGPKPAVCFVP